MPGSLGLHGLASRTGQHRASSLGAVDYVALRAMAGNLWHAQLAVGGWMRRKRSYAVLLLSWHRSVTL